ncbi:MAG: transcription antitermination factor NusB [Chloroflexi bacterium]|nr:transcription antitermination factor NusB [Chloroflexota bacterium]
MWRDSIGEEAGEIPSDEIGCRRLARAIAVQALYEADLTGHAGYPIAERLAAEAGIGIAPGEFAVWLAETVETNRLTLDEKLKELAPAWPIDQLSPIDRNILRLALAELEHGKDETPQKVIVSEAIELATLFGSEGSKSFVNGVLGAVLA